MKKEYVKPQNRVVELKDKLMDGPGQGSDTNIFDSKGDFNEDYNEQDSSSDVWED